MLIKIGSALVDPAEIIAIKPYPDECLKIDIILRNSISLLTDASMDEAEAALIDAGVFTDLVPDPEQEEAPVPDMNADEIDRIVELKSDDYEYMARDKDEKLYAYRVKPVYDGAYWNDPGPIHRGALQILEDFDFISKDDKEPTEINRLLGMLS